MAISSVVALLLLGTCAINAQYITTKDGNVVVKTEQGKDVKFEIGNETIGMKDIPSDLRSYTDATVQALDLGFRQGLNQGETKGAIAALNVKMELKQEIDEKLDESVFNSYKSTVDGKLSTQKSEFQGKVDDVEKKANANTAAIASTKSEVDAALEDLSIDVKDGSLDFKPCKSDESGKSYFSKKINKLMVCDGAKWGGLQALGSAANPAPSCQAIIDARPDAMSGMYTLKFKDGKTYITKCEMTVEGGGWTRFHTIRDQNGGGMLAFDQNYPAAFRGNKKCNAENVDIGNWVFSKQGMDNSDKKLLIMDADDRWFTPRYHMYDFGATTTCKNNFVKTVTGDYRPCNPKIYNFVDKKWESTSRGSCNTNQHSQWNCHPCNGIRFHYGTRECANDGGGRPGYNTWGWFTGYQCSCGCNNDRMRKWVKNWNEQFNRVSTDLYYR